MRISLHYALLSSSLKSVAAASSSGFLIISTCMQSLDLPEKEAEEKWKEEVKAPRILTHALVSFLLLQNPPIIFFSVYFAEKHN